MSKIKIFTDSTSDLSKDMIVDNDISVVPLYVSFGDDSLKDDIEINTKDLYNKVNSLDKLPSTSSPSPRDFYDAFKNYIDNGYEIIYIGLSSKLSSTIQNALIAASEFEEDQIEVIDSLNLSTGIGLLVMKAVDLRDEGYSLKEISNKIKELVPKVETNFVINTLDYLYKGGRCSALTTIIGTALKIRPIIKVSDGKMIVHQKTRGKKIKALNQILTNTLKDKNNIDNTRLMITHSMADDDAMYLKNELSKNLDIKDICITEAGCVISSHCGPSTIGILYIKK